MDTAQKDLEHLLLEEFRTVCISKENDVLTDCTLQESLTVNENLLSLGWTLSGEGIVELAKSKSRTQFYDKVSGLMSNMKAKPMYPDFPNQVMEMDKATLRLHQLFHYFSTYGMESLTGAEVQKGWLPSVEETEKIEEDATLLDAKQLKLIDSKETAGYVIDKIFSQKARMSIPESRLLALVLHTSKKEELKSILKGNMPKFKENIGPICDVILDDDEMQEKESVYFMYSIMQHSGDAFKALKYILDRHHWRLKKRQKRVCVMLLESFPTDDFEENLIISIKKANTTKEILRFIDYNTYSHSAVHQKLVNQLRNGELRSWESRMKEQMEKAEKGRLPRKKVIEFIGKRPGILLRMVAELLKKGYSAMDIQKSLTDHAEALSTRTLTSVISHFTAEEMDEGRNLLIPVLSQKLKTIHTELEGKKVFIDTGIFSLEDSELGKAEEGGYLTQGLAVRIPENVNVVRYFVYWNDKNRVDVDLHVFGYNKAGLSDHIGWDGDYVFDGIYFSGDITHSDAAEYIDIDLNRTTMDYAMATIRLYDGAQNFQKIDECFTGLMAVKKLNKEIKLYNPKNCFFAHDLMSNKSAIFYGIIDIKKRILKLALKKDRVDNVYWIGNESDIKVDKKFFSIQEYLDLLLDGQQCQIVDTAEEAEIILTMDRKENSISMIDNRFWLDN